MSSIKVTALLMLIITANSGSVRVPESARNLLLEAKVLGNLESFKKGLRGAVDHMIYDNQTGRFVQESQHHEYGVGFGEDLGIITEDKGAWWMAQWKGPVKANLIVLSGVYDNQPQPKTEWKIELRQEGEWMVHARGVGGWYDRGRYTWGGPETEAITFDALRVTTFSKDEQTSIGSIHYRGEKGVSWVVAYCPPIDARIARVATPLRAGEVTTFEAMPVLGDITSWKWDFGDGATGSGPKVSHTFDKPGKYDVQLVFSDDKDNGRLTRTVVVHPPIEARIRPLDVAVKVGHDVEFSGAGSVGKITKYEWEFGDGYTGSGKCVQHTYSKAGIYKVVLKVSDGTYLDECLALIRVNTTATVNTPKVYLDTDAKNEKDDQHYLTYGFYQDLDVLAVNSIHHGGGESESINYAEIQHIIDLCLESGLAPVKIPGNVETGNKYAYIFHGATEELNPQSGLFWQNVNPAITDASEMLLASARGASPGNPVWWVPVGPGTNVASALIMAKQQGLDLSGRVKIMWLGAQTNRTGEFNYGNDPGSITTISAAAAELGIEFNVMPADVGGTIGVASSRYPSTPIGEYLRSIAGGDDEPLFDQSCLHAIYSRWQNLGWELSSRNIRFPSNGEIDTSGGHILQITDINEGAMADDFYTVIGGQ